MGLAVIFCIDEWWYLHDHDHEDVERIAIKRKVLVLNVLKLLSNGMQWLVIGQPSFVRDQRELNPILISHLVSTSIPRLASKSGKELQVEI